jgi:hypothetical protein
VSNFAKAAALLRRLLPYLTAAIVIAVAYDGWIFYSRWSAARQSQKAAEHEQVEETRRTLEMLGGDRLKILDFYAAPRTIHPGERSTICYGVNAADRVRIDPPVEEIRPAISRCIQVAPAQTTDYKLSAQDRAGHTATASLTIKVAP